MAAGIGRSSITSVPVDDRNRCRIGHYGWEVDPEYPTYAFPIDSQKSILVKVYIKDKKIQKINFIPLWMTKRGQPEPLHHSDPRSEEVLNYMKWLCKDQALDTEFIREGDEIRILTQKI